MGLLESAATLNQAQNQTCLCSAGCVKGSGGGKLHRIHPFLPTTTSPCPLPASLRAYFPTIPSPCINVTSHVTSKMGNTDVVMALAQQLQCWTGIRAHKYTPDSDGGSSSSESCCEIRGVTIYTKISLF